MATEERKFFVGGDRAGGKGVCGRVNRYACTSMEKCSRLQVDIIYTAPKVLTELHVHLWKCVVDYR
jgi:hypothetical protein